MPVDIGPTSHWPDLARLCYGGPRHHSGESNKHGSEWREGMDLCVAGLFNSSLIDKGSGIVWVIDSRLAQEADGRRILWRPCWHHSKKRLLRLHPRLRLLFYFLKSECLREH